MTTGGAPGARIASDGTAAKYRKPSIAPSRSASTAASPRAVVVVDQDDDVAGLRRRLLRAAQRPAEERVRDVADDQADGARRPGPQRARRRVRAVAQLGRGRPDRVDRRRADPPAGLAGEDERDRGLRDPGLLGDVDARHLARPAGRGAGDRARALRVRGDAVDATTPRRRRAARALTEAPQGIFGSRRVIRSTVIRMTSPHLRRSSSLLARSAVAAVLLAGGATAAVAATQDAAHRHRHAPKVAVLARLRRRRQPGRRDRPDARHGRHDRRRARDPGPGDQARRRGLRHRHRRRRPGPRRDRPGPGRRGRRRHPLADPAAT